jgi:CDP-diacylglycerol--glycerol-3-phosphate 3-phosphatidyltransferase
MRRVLGVFDGIRVSAAGYVILIIPLNAPNLLTLTRIALVPVMLLLLLDAGTWAPYAAAAVFGVAAITDAADGYLARAHSMATRFGAIVDPLADKLLVGAALGGLVAVGRLELWVALAVIAREVGVSGLRWYGSRTHGLALPVSSIGKAKTGVQMVAIPTLMLVPNPDAFWVESMVLAMVTVTIVSGLDYLLAYARATGDDATAPAIQARG